MSFNLTEDVLVTGTWISVRQYERALKDPTYLDDGGFTIEEYLESAKSWVDALQEEWSKDE